MPTSSIADPRSSRTAEALSDGVYSSLMTSTVDAELRAPRDETSVLTWIRWLVLALAIPQLVTGLWAVFDPANFFESFPGFGPALVAAEPPLNNHLATDAGAGFLATGIALLWAFARPRRETVLMALATYLAFAVPHAAYHIVNPSPGLTASEDVTNAITLLLGVALALTLGWFTVRSRR